MATVHNTTTHRITNLDTALAFIRSLPTHYGRGRRWTTDPVGCAHLVRWILSTEVPLDTMKSIAAAQGTSTQPYQHLCRGNDNNGGKWPALRASLVAFKVKWINYDRDVARETHPLAAPPQPEAPCPANGKVIYDDATGRWSARATSKSARC